MPRPAVRDDDRILTPRDPWLVGAATVVATFIAAVVALVTLVAMPFVCSVEGSPPPGGCAGGGTLSVVVLLGAPLAVVLGGGTAGVLARWLPLGIGVASAAALIATLWVVGP